MTVAGPTRSRIGSRLVLLVALAGLALVVAAVATGALAPADRTETGWVAGIDDRSLTEVAGFTLRTADGRLLEFAVGRLTTDATSFPAGHLREHRLLNQPVVVTWRQEGEARVAVRLQDAPTDDGAPSAHPSSASSSWAGSAKPNSDPPSGRARPQTRPPIASMSWRQTKRPIPAPAALRVADTER